MALGELLELGAQLDDLLLPWQIDLHLRHLIAHEGLRIEPPPQQQQHVTVEQATPLVVMAEKEIGAKG